MNKTPSGTMLPEHRDNPFVAGLESPMDTMGIFDLMSQKPVHDPSEARLEPHLRRYCVLRLLDYVDPVERQMHLVERIHMAIRQGYKGRDPVLGLHRAAHLAAVGRVEAGHLDHVSNDFSSSAVGFAVLGVPGMGKSLTVRRALGAFSRVLRPSLPYTCTQIPWLMVQCPGGGSVKQLCKDCITQIDNLLGTTYGRSLPIRLSEGDHLLQLQLKLQLHAVGILVIDEIQHLNASPKGVKLIMNFLVSLVNRVGIPVVLVGTMGAANIIQADFHEARRASGLGSIIWDRLPEGPDWDDVVAQIWNYQWTARPTELTMEIRRVLYDECQGVLDLLVKLFILSQLRAISRGEVHGPDEEQLSAGLLAQVARDEFKIVAPMVRAMRKNRTEALIKYSDLTPLQNHFDQAISAATDLDMKSVREIAAASQAAAAVAAAEDPTVPIRAALIKAGLDRSTADSIITKVRDENPSADLFQLAERARELVSQASAKPTRTPRVSAPRRSATTSRQKPPSVKVPEDRSAQEKDKTVSEMLTREATRP